MALAILLKINNFSNFQFYSFKNIQYKYHLYTHVIMSIFNLFNKYLCILNINIMYIVYKLNIMLEKTLKLY